MANTEGIRAGRAYVELGIGDKLSAGLKRAQERLKGFGEGVTTWGTRIFAVGSALATPAVAAAKTFATMGDAIAKAAKRTGMGTDALSELGYAAELSGTDVETLEGAVRKMQKTIDAAAGGSKSAEEALAGLGLSAAALKGLSPDQQFTLLAEAVSRIADPTERAVAAMKVFGRSGTSLLPMIEKGAAGLGEMRDEARKLGLSIGGADAAAAERLSDGFDRMWRVLKGVTFQIGAALAPAMSDLLEKAATWVSASITWLRQNSGLILSLAKLAAGVVGAGAALVGVGKAVTVFSSFIGVAGTVLGAMLSPVGMVIAAVGALGGYFLYATGAGGAALDWLGGKFATLKADAMAAYQGIAGALAAGDIGLAAKVLWLTLKMEWTRGVGALTRVWSEWKFGFLKIMSDAWYGAQAIAVTVRYGLEVGWTETTSYLAKAWSAFVWGFKALCIELGSAAQKAWTWIKSVFDDSIDVGAENKKIDEANIDSYRDLAAEQNATARQREADRKKELTDSKKRWHQDVLGIGNARDASRKALDAEQAAAVDAVGTDLADAQKAWADAVAEGKKKGEDAAGNDDGPGKLKGPDDLLNRIGAAAGGLGERVATSLGTFNAARLQGFGTSDALNRTAAACEKTAKNTQKLVDEGEDEFE
jgi:hypothetical protein